MITLFLPAFQGTMSHCAPFLSKSFAHDQGGPQRGGPSHDRNHAPLPIASSWKCAWWCHSIQVLPPSQRCQQPSMKKQFKGIFFFRRQKSVFEWFLCLQYVFVTHECVRLGVGAPSSITAWNGRQTNRLQSIKIKIALIRARRKSCSVVQQGTTIWSTRKLFYWWVSG